jgi:hypothetical protein
VRELVAAVASTRDGVAAAGTAAAAVMRRTVRSRYIKVAVYIAILRYPPTPPQ